MASLLAGLLERYGGPEPADEEPTQTKACVARALVHYRLSQSDGIPAALPPPHERVLIGSAGCAYNKEGLTKAGVTHIVCLCSSVRHCFPSEIIYLTPQVELNDDGTVVAAEQFKASMGSILRFISAALAESLQHKVLIHCMQGVSRAPAIVQAWLQVEQGLSYDDARAAVFGARPSARPNPVFGALLRSLTSHAE